MPSLPAFRGAFSKPESGRRVRMGGMTRADGAHNPAFRDAIKRHFRHKNNISAQIRIFVANRKIQNMLTVSYSEFVADPAKQKTERR